MSSNGSRGRLGRDIGCLWPAIGVAAGAFAVVLVVGLGAAARAARVSQVLTSPSVLRVRVPSPTPSPPATVEPTVTPTAPPAGPVGAVAVGYLVEIFGTGGDGVRLRAEPNLDGAVNGLGTDSEVFQVEQGPVEGEGHVWWYLVNPYDSGRQGWAVADYLRPLQGS
jgi:hypothetical protein